MRSVAIEGIISDEEVKSVICSKKTIIGINHYGAILAALLGYKYKKSFAYIFDSEKIVDTLEREINNVDKNGIILIIDVVVFGDSLSKVLDRMEEKSLIDESIGVDVLVLFERIYKRNSMYNLSKMYSSRFIKKIFIVNDSFDIEICNKNRDECIFRKGTNDIICDNERNE